MADLRNLVTYAEAAVLLDCGVSNVPKLIRRGLLTGGGRGRGPSLSRLEVERLAVSRVQEQQASARRATAAVAPRPGRPAPASGYRWLTPAETGALIGITAQAVRKRCQAGTIPHVRTGGRWWVREDHARLAAHVRATDGPEAVAMALRGID